MVCAADLLATSMSPVMSAGLLLGLMLLAAILGGYAARLARVPRVVGYLVAGVALRWLVIEAFAGPVGSQEQTDLIAAGKSLQGIKTLALGLIMFAIGGVFEVDHLKAVGAKVLRISLSELGSVFLLVSLGCTLVWAIGGPQDLGAVVAAGVLLGVIGMATAPAATLLVLREYDAKGPVSDTILTLTALNNTTCIVLFHCLVLVLSAMGLVQTNLASGGLLWLDLVVTSVGSVGLGIVLGFVFSVLYAKVPLPEFVLIFLALLLGLGEGDQWLASHLHLSFNYLLSCLAFGAVFANITLDQGPLNESLRVLTVPIFGGFFVIAGYELHIEDLAALGILGVAYVGLRSLGKLVGAHLGVRWACPDTEVRSYLGLGMLCQAGVAIGLVDFLYSAWVQVDAGGVLAPHPMAAQLKTVVLGSVVVFELAGPVVLKEVVKRSGEVTAISLLRRRRTSPAEGDSITRLTFQALLRMFGLRRSAGDGKDPLQVRHIMRSNIKLLRASARLHEVLHFVEASRYNHFPVVDGKGHFVGMIHFSDLRDMIYDPHMRDLVTAVDLADPSTPIVPVDMSLDDLFTKFQSSDVASLAVVESAESRRVVGIVEQRDLLRMLHRNSLSS
jgi:CBS domain-containing protein